MANFRKWRREQARGERERVEEEEGKEKEEETLSLPLTLLKDAPSDLGTCQPNSIL